MAAFSLVGCTWSGVLPIRSPSRVTDNSCEPARATVSEWALKASLMPWHPVIATQATVNANRDRVFICLMLQGIGGGRSHQAAQGARQPVEHGGSAQPRELERERPGATDFRLELHFVKSRGQPLHARHRGIVKGNTRFVPAHQDALHPQRTT